MFLQQNLKRYNEEQARLKEEAKERRLRDQQRTKAEADSHPKPNLKPKQKLRVNHAKTNTPLNSRSEPLLSGYDQLVKKNAKSNETIPKSVDRAVGTKSSSKNQVKPGISHRYGPVSEMNGDGQNKKPTVNGDSNAKRKSRSSVGDSKNYKEASSESESDRPLVCYTTAFVCKNSY